ncbi:MAG TPA: hypothetical protein VK217_01055, partial [Acidimicrobiales bacterium]|nr:hypothetical protein [Acidimicrobiales bacterium]
FLGASGAIVVLVGLLAWCWRGVPGRGERPSESPSPAVDASGPSAAAAQRDRPPSVEPQVVTG